MNEWTRYRPRGEFPWEYRPLHDSLELTVTIDELPDWGDWLIDWASNRINAFDPAPHDLDFRGDGGRMNYLWTIAASDEYKAGKRLARRMKNPAQGGP